jgi:hypothetical protein
MKQMYGLLICGILLLGLAAEGCFTMGDGSPAPRPSVLISATLPMNNDSSTSSSALIVPYDIDRLIRESDCIVSGRVEEILPSKAYTPTAGTGPQYNIYTDIIIQVERNYWGAAGDRLVIRVQGGKIGNLVMWAEDVPLFARDEKALFFLHLPLSDQSGASPSSAESGSYYLVTGAMQGKYEYQDSAFISMSGQSLTQGELEQKIARVHGK